MFSNNNNINFNNNTNKRRGNYSLFFDSSVFEAKSKKICDYSNLSLNFSKKISLSGISDFEFFQLNLHKMQKLDQLNSTEIEQEDADDQESVENLELNHLLTLPDPQLVDLMKAIACVVKVTTKTSKEVSSINKKMCSLAKKVDNNSNNIKIINNNANLQHNQIMKNIESINYLKQEKIDKEVFISGFATVPDDKLALKELFKFYNTPQNKIQTCRIIPVKNPDGSIKGAFMNLQFCTKEDQIAFLKTVKDKGPITSKTVMPSTSGTPDGKKLKISRRLTIENRQVIGRLLSLQEQGKISKTRFRNCFYQVQPLGQDKFIPIPSTDHLDMYLNM